MNRILKDHGLTGSMLVMLMVLFLLTWQPREAGAETAHACNYLTPAMVEKVMGRPVLAVESQPANSLGQSVCFFKLSTSDNHWVQLQMVCSSWPGLESKGWTAKSLFENNMSFLDELEEEQGLGEQAYWAGSALQLGSGLHVLSEDCFFTILAVTGEDDAHNRAKSRELALQILDLVGKK